MSVPSEDFVNKGLIPDAAPACFLAELIEHTRVDSDCDQLARLVPKWRTTDATQGFQLLRGRIWNVGEINRSPRTPPARGGSRAAR